MKRIFFITIILFLVSSCRKTEDIDNNILRIYGDALEDIGYSIARAENGFVIAGQLTDVFREGTNYIKPQQSVKKMGIIKTDIDGNVIWQKSFPQEKLTAIGMKAIVLDDGSIVCVGHVIDTVTLLKDIFILKTDSQGELISQKIYKNSGDVANQYATDLIKTPDGFLILGATDAENAPVTDSSGNEAGNTDVLFLKIDNNFDLVSSTAKGYPGNDEGVALKNDINGGYIVVATTERSDRPKTEQDGKNILLLKYNSLGVFTQSRIIGKVGDEYASDIEVSSDGYLIAGTVGTEGLDQNGYIWKMPQNIFDPPVDEHAIVIGNTGSPLLYKINGISSYKTSSYVMAGQVGTGSSARMLIFLTDNGGNLLSGKSVITGGTGTQSANDVISDDSENIFAVGKNSYESNSMFSLLKFRF